MAHKNSQSSQQKFVWQWLFSIENLQFESEGPAFDSGRVHLGGFNVRADQKDQKADFEYPPQNLPMPILARADHAINVIIPKS